MNVQTAKHYGNLGRLYQSMRRFREAQEMHLRAIDIKERLLGPEDYEVALSVGHLASLYNYDMRLYQQAEQLGLEYDYRGLLRVSMEMKQDEPGAALHARARGVAPAAAAQHPRGPRRLALHLLRAPRAPEEIYQYITSLH
ncbi:hypothetical protein HPB48_002809 [Haemaphysalis longicornis]|uniref:Uncharacterized protein n=1 Tax=Haemaphysalis longicornis TaxID=44386 RepID=A0A9J6GNC6_HAELO|nr:hypothetical protein HPB48_002809 [Haemaphysalis longicornis]